MAIPKLQVYALPTAPDVPVNKVDWVFDPERAMLLIHDMQDYLTGFQGDNYPMMEQAVVNIAALCQYYKEHNIPVYYTAQSEEQGDESRALLNNIWRPGLMRSPERQEIAEALASNETGTILVKWRYGTFHRPPLGQILEEAGCNQLIITGVHTHIGCMTTAVDAFMRDIKPFTAADALADFSHDEHLMSLRYVAGRFGRVVMIQELLPTPISISKNVLHGVILPLLDESEEPTDDENLIDYGPDSVCMMVLAARRCKAYDDIDFVMLARKPTIDAWQVLLSREVK